MFNKLIVATLTAALDTCQAAAKTPREAKQVEQYRARLMLAARPSQRSTKLLAQRNG
jgi:hypothetical protein